MLVLVGLDATFKQVNPSFERTLGWTKEEVISKRFMDFVHPDDHQKTIVQGKDVGIGKDVARVETRFLCKDGSYKWISWSSHPLPEKQLAISIGREITERKKAEEALKTSEEKANALIKYAPTGIYEIDYQVPKFKTVNDAMCKILGVTREELLATNPLDLLDDESKVRFKERIMKLLDGQTVDENVEFKVKAKDGRIIYAVLNVMFTYKDGKPDGAVVIAHDVTARKQTEEKLRESEQRWATTLASIGDAVIATDLSGKVTFMNVEAEKLTGWKLNEASMMQVKEIFNIVNEETRLEVEDPVSKVLEKGIVVGLANHTVLIKKDKTEVAIDDSGAPIQDKDGKTTGVVLIFRDITDRKKAEEMLRKANEELETRVVERTREVLGERERLYSILETLPAYVVLLDKDYRMPFANKVFRETFGESHGRRCHDFLFGKDSECDNCETYKVLKTNKPQRWEWTGPNRRDYDIYDFPFAGADGSTLILEMGLDVTERKKAEASVHDERKRLLDVMETLPLMICLLTPDYHVAFANRSFREKFGESNGRRCYEYCFGRSQPCEFCESFNVLKTGKPHHWEVNAPDGSVIDAYDYPFADAEGSPMILEMDIDVTDQRHAEKQLRSASLYSRTLIEASLDPLVTINAEGKITDVNKATELATGSSRAELIGSDFCDYFMEPEKAKVGYKRVFTEGVVKDYPLAIRHKKGKITDVLYNATVYTNEAGEIQGVFAAARDITEQRKAEAEAQSAAKKLKDAERLAAIGATAGMVGHDIRNPLQAITGDLYLAKTELADVPDSPEKNNALENLQEIEKNIDYINKIVADLQDFARPLKPHLEDSDLKQIINDLLTKNGLPKDVKVTVKVEDSAMKLQADSSYLNRILYNLVTNAVQAMPKGGKLTIHAYREADDAVITVKDTGVGIPDQVKDKLFTPMFTTKSKGQGFGLAVIKRMTEALGGEVTFKSQEGKGTKFTVRFPQNVKKKTDF